MNEGQGTERLLEDRQVGLPWHPTQTFYHALKRPPHDSDSEHAVVRRAGAMRRIHEGAVIPDTPALGGEAEPCGPGDFLRLAEVRLGPTEGAGRREPAGATPRRARPLWRGRALRPRRLPPARGSTTRADRGRRSNRASCTAGCCPCAAFRTGRTSAAVPASDATPVILLPIKPIVPNRG